MDHTEVSDQLSISVLKQSHHLTSIRYPDLDLIESDTERLALFPVANAKNRYEPLPLVPIPAVVHNAYRDTDDETSFFLLYEANANLPPPSMSPRLNGRRQGELLVHHMEQATQCIGRTTLHVVTYSEKDDTEDSCVLMRIFRRTSFQIHGQNVEDELEYDLTGEEFSWILDHSTWADWIRHLMYRKSDRAINHVRRTLAQSRYRDESGHSWRPKRGYSLNSILEDVLETLRVADLPDMGESLDCSICCDPYNEQTSNNGTPNQRRPVKLTCGKHVICFQCASDWTHHGKQNNEHPPRETPLAADCTYCRIPFFSEQVLSSERHRDLQMGLTEGFYLYDPQFSEWENHERSCADLDLHLAADCDTLWTVDGFILGKAWAHLCERAKLESDTSTPKFLQPCNFSEMAIAQQAVLEAVHGMEGQRLAISKIFRILLESIYFALLDKCNEARFSRCRSPREWIAMVANPQETEVFQSRPGFQEFLVRSVSRMLMFSQVRRCMMMRHFWHGDRKTLHQHAFRMYFSWA